MGGNRATLEGIAIRKWLLQFRSDDLLAGRNAG